MKSLQTLCFIFVCTVLAVANTTASNAETNHAAHHTHNKNTASMLVLNNGEKWKTDAPLRQGMQSINDAVIHAKYLFHHKNFTQQQAQKLAKHIKSQVAYLIANCNLEPKADAALHVLIAKLLASSDQLLQDPLSHQGLPTAVKTLKQYSIYFDHPAWGGAAHELFCIG